MKISFLKRIKPNNRYNYTPRYYKGKDEETTPYEMGTKFDKFVDTYNKNDFGAHWRDARKNMRNRGNVEFNRTVLIIMAVLILIFLWIIDFDLSIFTQ
ncbi:MAG: hypothetical protein KJO05_09555 [Bacteroidia bacterium]|nr:hypothetical protein [Bacteroidia bacterium]NNF30138.1 hypothetical protein [Flavobacteriaceae bacterium]MBT8275016.1 hypothetical protein [Bacteroidia bacterium]NNJ81802.1 hypothetical protein [Flavobacteriaceae bacterium]NNK55498.1 hypothetical protein [Flavobacteriaceae bacterium]